MELTTILLFRKLHRSFRPIFRALAFVVIVITVGTAGFMRLEHLGFADAVYFTVVTMSTIGYGDISPTSNDSRIFAIFFIPLGVSAFLYTFSTILMIVFEGRLMEVLKVEQAKDEIERLKNHIVLCGYGDVGEYIAKNLKSAVVVESDEGRYKEVLKAGLLGVKGDSTIVETLREAGIERAKTLIIALNQDPKTVFTILTVKELNPKVRIYARANRTESVKKIKQAGADYVICLPEIGGREMLNALEGDKKQD